MVYSTTFVFWSYVKITGHTKVEFIKKIECICLGRVKRPSDKLVSRMHLGATLDRMVCSDNQIMSIYRAVSIRKWPDNLIRYTYGHRSCAIRHRESCIILVNRYPRWLQCLLETVDVWLKPAIMDLWSNMTSDSLNDCEMSSMHVFS